MKAWDEDNPFRLIFITFDNCNTLYLYHVSNNIRTNKRIHIQYLDSEWHEFHDVPINWCINRVIVTLPSSGSRNDAVMFEGYFVVLPRKIITISTTFIWKVLCWLFQYLYLNRYEIPLKSTNKKWKIGINIISAIIIIWRYIFTVHVQAGLNEIDRSWIQLYHVTTTVIRP